jgi:hypothetical protein
LTIIYYVAKTKNSIKIVFAWYFAKNTSRIYYFIYEKIGFFGLGKRENGKIQVIGSGVFCYNIFFCGKFCAGKCASLYFGKRVFR